MAHRKDGRAVAFFRAVALILMLLDLVYVAITWDVSVPACLVLAMSLGAFAMALLLQIDQKEKEIQALRKKLRSATGDE